MTFVFSLIGGLLIAVAIQLVFANLGLALGLSVLDWSPGGEAIEATAEEDGDDRIVGKDRSLPITHLLGFGVAVGFSFVIFVATLLSVEFSELISPRRGMVFGLIFWATYWLLFVWLSSTTIAGIADSLLDSALSGGKQLVGTIKQALERDEKKTKGDVQQTNQQTSQQSMLEALVAEVSQLSEVQSQLPMLLANQREALVDEICDRTNLSSQEAETIISGLDIEADEPTPEVSVSRPASRALLAQLDLPSWQQILRQALSKVDLSDWDFETLWQQLPSSAEKVQYLAAQSSIGQSSIGQSLISQSSESAVAVLPQPDLSEENENATQLNGANASSFEVSAADIRKVKGIESKLISYCRYTNVDSLTPEKLIEKVQTQREAYDLIEDEKLLNLELNVNKIAAVLSKRKKLGEQKRSQLVDALKQSWPTHTSETAPPDDTLDDNKDAMQPARDTYQAIESYFQSVDWSSVSLEDLKPEVNLLLEQLEREGTLNSMNWQQLGSRVQIPPSLRAEVTTWLQSAWLARIQAIHPAVTQSAQDISQQIADQITDYLQNQDKSDLSSEKITEGLSKMVSGAIATLPHPSSLLNAANLQSLLDVDAWAKRLWDRERWQQALENRKDLTAEEIQQILEWGERVWQPKAQQVGGWLKVIRAEVGERLPSDLLAELKLSDVSLPSVDLPNIHLPEENPLTEVRQQIAGQIATAQEKISQQAIAIKEDLQNQADAARRQVAIAAWWLFVALVVSGGAATGAGWLAATY